MSKKQECKEFSKVLTFATNKHLGQLRRDGSPYIMHPIRVAQFLKDYDIKYQIAALLHDVLEDTDTTEEELLSITTPEVIEAVKLLTKKKNIDLAKYVNDILLNPIAKVVKAADRIDNLKDCIYASADFQKKYILQTEEYYKGKFGDELDKQLEKTKETIEYNDAIAATPQTINDVEKKVVEDDGYVYLETNGTFPIFFRYKPGLKTIYKFTYTKWEPLADKEYEKYEFDVSFTSKKNIINWVSDLIITHPEKKDFYENALKLLNS